MVHQHDIERFAKIIKQDYATSYEYLCWFIL